MLRLLPFSMKELEDAGKLTGDINKILFKGFPRNKVNKKRLSILISNMSKELKTNFAKTKCTGLAIE